LCRGLSCCNSAIREEKPAGSMERSGIGKIRIGKLYFS
jgi:hypothetical protein